MARLTKRSEYSVGQVAKRAGIAVSALHYYESLGLIFSSRNSGNQRRYEASVLRRIAVIKTAQRLGISLQEIAQAMSHLPKHKAPTTSDWNEMSQLWREALDTRINQMLKMRDQLDSCIGCGCLSIKACRLRNPDDEAGDKGEGPVFWEQES